MPRTMHGTGGTQRELILDLARDAYARGHATALVGNFKPSMQVQMSTTHMEATLNHRRTGKRLIICGDSKMGSDHVCGS